MSENLGSGTSIVLNPQDLAYQLVVWQNQKPPTDAELNFVGQITTEERAKEIRSLMPSGFIGSSIRSDLDYYFHKSFTNYFYLGRQLEVDTGNVTSETSGVKNILWANVNGWVIPVTGTNVNNLLTLNNADYRNKILLSYAPTSGFKSSFVFLEVWKKLLSVDPSVSGKPSATSVYKHGNVEFGGTNLTDDLLRTDIGAETTKRVQLQYRIRVVDSVDAISYPTCFEDTSNVYARANLSVSQSLGLAQSLDIAFYPVSGDEGLWRSGNGNPDNGLGTVDGYAYAIPICMVRRRNRGGWSISSINGGISRSAPPTGYVEGNQVNGVPLSDSDLNAAPDSDRPDGLYADYIVDTDIIDMRNHVIPGRQDYSAILKENINLIYANKLHTSPKYITVGGVQYGSTYLVTDELNSSVTDNPSTIHIGKPDGIRRIFSDTSVYQAKNLSVFSASSKEAASPSFGTDSSNWMPGDIVSIPHPVSLQDVDYPSVFLDAETQVTYEGGTNPVCAGFVTSATSNTLTSTGSFTTFYSHTTQWAGYAIVIVEGTGQGQIRTLTTINSNNQVSINSTWGVTPDSTSAFIIQPPLLTFSTSSNNTEMLVTIESINGVTDFDSIVIRTASLLQNIWVDYVMLYPAGQGLSLRPDNIFRVNYTNPSSTILRRPLITSSTNLLDLRPIELSYDFANKANTETPIESESYYDEGSKTVILQPFQRVNISLTPREYVPANPDHSFYSLFNQRYSLEIPSAYLPSLGSHAIPIISSSIGVFFTGLHVWAFDETDSSIEVAINLLGRSSFSDDTYVGSTVLVRQDSISYEDLDSGTPNKIGCRLNPDVGGIELPNYIGPSRILGIFEKTDFAINSIDGTNLLNYSVQGSLIDPNIWIGKTSDHKDVTFTILPGAITDYSASTEYVIVCNLFGFREGFILENGLITAHEQITNTDETFTLSLVLPRPLPSNAIVQITYDRSTYQGSIYNRYEPFATTTPEPFDNRGLVSPTDLTNLDDVLTSCDLGNAFNFEILANCEIFTTLGTGKFSGKDSGRYYDKSNVVLPQGTPKHELLKSFEIGSNTAGFITRLPLGSRYRDADFAGENLQIGGQIGNFIYSENPETGIKVSNIDECVLGPGSFITLTDGNTATSDLTQYRVTRGGSGFFQSPSLGAAISLGPKEIQIGFRGLRVTALLVKTFEEEAPLNVELPVDENTNPLTLKGRAGELQLVIITSVIDEIYDDQSIYSKQITSSRTAPTGIGEGYVSIDRYRCVGRPLEHQNNLLTWTHDTNIIETLDTAVSLQPYLYNCYPNLASTGDVLTLRGKNLSTVKSISTGDGVEVFVRSTVSGPSSTWVFVDTLFDYSASYIKFKATATIGSYDVMVRAGNGDVSILEEAFSIGDTVDDIPQVMYLENFLSYDLGKFPSSTTTDTGWATNQPRAFRVTKQDAYIGNRCGIFSGTGRSTSDIVRLNIPSDVGVLGTDHIYCRYSFKLLDSSIDIGNTFSIFLQEKHSGSITDLLNIEFTSASTTYVLLAQDSLTGDGTISLPTGIPLDNLWHTVSLEVEMDGTTTIKFDDVALVSGDIYNGDAILSNYSPGRLVLQNDVSSAVTSVNCLIDDIYFLIY